MLLVFKFIISIDNGQISFCLIKKYLENIKNQQLLKKVLELTEWFLEKS